MSPDGFSVVSLPLARVCEDQNFNIRIFYGDIDDLAVRLMTEGQREPIKVRRDGAHYFVVDGHRRHRAFLRAKNLRIEGSKGKYSVVAGTEQLRDSPGPLHPSFDANRIHCRIIQPPQTERELFSSHLTYNSGKPFTALERMIFVARLNRLAPATRDELALQTGLSRTYIANALQLNTADPRLLDYVREERVSQKLALRLLRVFPPGEQLAKLAAAAAAADRNSRIKILPKDIEWPNSGWGEQRTDRVSPKVDAVRARLHAAVSRLGGQFRFAPNPAARERLATLMLIDQYTAGQVPYGRLEAHLLGRE